MAPGPPRLRILSVGGNAVSAFLSWRLQATNACDVTLVWKSGYESVSQFGISFKSKVFGNERFKPRQVVTTPEEAAAESKTPFDYVLLCVKALPDVYDISSIIESVVSPQHTCILLNTTHNLGIETYVEQRFPTNVVLSLVCGAEISQIGPSEFEHLSSTDIWVGPANANAVIPSSIQSDMAEALAMTLNSGQVDCQVSSNIRQQQFDRMIGPIAFHPASVLFNSPNHAELIEKVGVRSLVSETIEELIRVATAQGCTFPANTLQRVVDEMTRPTDIHSIMFQDFVNKRPMEVETYLGSPLKLAQQSSVAVPRIETLYALLHDLNIVNQVSSPQSAGPPSHAGLPPPRHSSVPQGRGSMPIPNGAMNGMLNGPMKGGMRPGSRAPSMTGPMQRRGPPPVNGFHPRPPNGHPYPPGGAGPGNLHQQPSLEGVNLEEFSHLVHYDNIPEDRLSDGVAGNYGENSAPSSSSDLALRERELALRQRELALREQEYNLRRNAGRRPPAPASHAGFDDDDDEDDFGNPMAPRSHAPMIDPDNFDMMSVTSRRNRKAVSAGQFRRNPEVPQSSRGRNLFSRNKNRTSARLMTDMPGLHDSIMENPLMGYSSNRYGAVDRQAMGQSSRSNSLTAARLDELQQAPGNMNGHPPRRTSQSPGNPLGPGPRIGGRPSPPNGYAQANGYPVHSRAPPPVMRQPLPPPPPPHDQGDGGAARQHQAEQQHLGVSSLYPPKSGPQVRSLTGSASASAGSGESGGSVPFESQNSSRSSLGPRPPIGVR